MPCGSASICRVTYLGLPYLRPVKHFPTINILKRSIYSCNSFFSIIPLGHPIKTEQKGNCLGDIYPTYLDCCVDTIIDTIILDLVLVCFVLGKCKYNEMCTLHLWIKLKTKGEIYDSINIFFHHQFNKIRLLTVSLFFLHLLPFLFSKHKQIFAIINGSNWCVRMPGKNDSQLICGLKGRMFLIEFINKIQHKLHRR